MCPEKHRHPKSNGSNESRSRSRHFHSIPKQIFNVNKFVHLFLDLYCMSKNYCDRNMKVRNVVLVCVIAILLSGLTVGVFRTLIPRLLIHVLFTSLGFPSKYQESMLAGSSQISVGPVENSEQYNIHHWSCDEYSADCNNRVLPAVNRYSKDSVTRSNIASVSFEPSNLNEDGSSKSLYGTSLTLRYKQKFPANKDVKHEAVAAMNVALDLQNQGKTEKALKVFQQAVNLDPSHAEILTVFGEFLEWHVKDIVKADHMYHIALEHSPEHGRALQNRKRTGPIVEEIDQARFNRVDGKRALFYTIPNSHPGLRRAKKEAYYAHIYHTNAIEGNTLTLIQTRAIVETRLAVGGKSLREQNEVLGLDSALSYINSTLVGRIGRLRLEDILDIHLRVLGYVDPTEAGRFRTTQVYIGDFTPPAANELKEHMDQLIEWLNSEEAQALHPIEFAALAHYRLVAIHPFFDGNGRTSRLLMNLILMQAGFPPVSIEVDDRLTYYETLEQANNGDIRPFIRFISLCAERTLDIYLESAVEDYELSLPSTHGARRKSTQKDRVIEVDNGWGEETEGQKHNVPGFS